MADPRLPPNFRWLEESRIAGSGLPETADQVDALHEAGIRAVVSFHPLPEVARERLRERGVEHLPFPIGGFTEPFEGSVATLFAFVAERAFPAAGSPRPVLFH
jgi:hypothetical protein